MFAPSSQPSRSRPQLSSLLIKGKDSLGKAINGANDGREDANASLLHLDSFPTRSWLGSTSLLPSPKTAAFVVSCLLWYLASALSSNTSKALLSSSKAISPRPPAPFPFPVTLTLIQFVFVHLLSSAIASPTIMRHVPGYRRPVTKIVSNVGWKRISDMAKLSIFNVVGHALSTVAISRVPVSTVHTIKALTPLFTVLSFRFIFNVHYSFMAYFSLVPLTLGVMMACTSLSFSVNDLVGLGTALASTFIFVAQSIYSKNLVGRGSEGQKASGLTASRDSDKLDKINIIYYTSACSTLIMIPMALYYDGPKMFFGQPATTSNEAQRSGMLYISALVTANGIMQFFQNFLAFSVLALVSPVTYSIASLFKRVFVICFAIIWFGQTVSGLQWLGIVLTFVGLYIYNGAKSSKSIAKGEEKMALEERRKSLSLPTTTRNTVWPTRDSPADHHHRNAAFPGLSATKSPSSAVQTSYNPNQTEQSSTPSSAVHHPRSASVMRSDPSAGSSTIKRPVLTTQDMEVATSLSAGTGQRQAPQHQRGFEIGIPLPFAQDPRRSIPSPPPSRGPSSDDEGYTHLQK